MANETSHWFFASAFIDSLTIVHTATPPANKRAGIKSMLAFTLIEVMVVITIVCVLAILTIFAFNAAMQAAISTTCTNNLRQLGVACFVYADDHDGWSPPALNNNFESWTQTLMDGGYVPSADSPNHPSGKQTIFLCPGQTPKGFWIADWTVSYGMRSGNAPFNPFKITYRIGAGTVMTPDNINFGAPSQFLFIGDTIFIAPGNSAQNLKQRYYFVPYFGAQNCVHMRHHMRGNFLFGDGHVESLTKSDLVGQYGAIDGSYSFIASQVNESPPQ